jgi:hypothetical protein
MYHRIIHLQLQCDHYSPNSADQSRLKTKADEYRIIQPFLYTPVAGDNSGLMSQSTSAGRLSFAFPGPYA